MKMPSRAQRGTPRMKGTPPRRRVHVPARRPAAVLPPESRPPRWQRRKDARPAEILDAALDTFVEHGYRAARLEDVARRAGVTKGTMYLYFENKEALFKAMVRAKVVLNIEQAEALVDGFEGSSRDLLVRLMTMWWERVVESPMSALPKLIIGEVAEFPDLAAFYHEEVVTRAKAVFERAVRRGIERGEFRALEPAVVVRLAMAPILLAALWKHSFQRCVSDRIELRRLFDGHVDLLLNGLVAAPRQEGSHA